jgi:alpha-2-macroglobulin
MRKTRIARAVAAVCFAGAAAVSQAQSSTGSDSRSIRVGDAVVRRVQEETPAARPAVPSPALRVAVLPCSTPDGDIRFRFSLPMNRVPPDDALFPVIRFEPQLQGSYRWTADRELTFTPLLPPQLGSNIRVVITRAVPVGGEVLALDGPAVSVFRVENFVMANKVSSLPVVRGNPRFVATLNSFSGLLGSRPVLLLFDQPVSASNFARLVKASAGRSSLQTSVANVISIESDLDGEIDPRHVLAVEVSPIPPDGSPVDLQVPTYEPNGIRRDIGLRLTVLTRLDWSSSEVHDLQTGRAARIHTVMRIRFNSKVDLRLFREALSVSPAPRSTAVSVDWRGLFVVDLNLDRGTEYRMRLDDRFRDAVGNRPSSPLDITFRSEDWPPMLQLPATPLMLEAGSNRLPVRMRNLRDLRVEVWRFPQPTAFAQGLARPAQPPADYGLSERTVLPARVPDVALNALADLELGLESRPGLRLVEVSGQGTGSEAAGLVVARLLVQTSSMAVSSKISRGAVLAWVTDLADGAPVQDAMVAAIDSRDGRVIGSAVSATDGTATIAVGDLATDAGLARPISVVATRGDDASVSRIVEAEMSSAWQFNMPATVEGSTRLDAAVFTDRGVYRPGDVVHIKIFARPLPGIDDFPLELDVRDPRGQNAFASVVRLDAFHGGDTEMHLPEATPVGAYSVGLRLKGASTRQTFRVEEYRVPTFDVRVETTPDEWSVGRTASTKVSARYLQGGALDGREVRWRVYRQIEEFEAPGLPGYVFSLDRDTTLTGMFAQGSATLNATGEAPISFVPDHSAQAGLLTYLVEASVTDYDRQNYAGRVSRQVHGTSRYAGLRPPARQIYREGDRIALPVVVVDTKGQVSAGAPVDLYLDQFEYHTTTMLNDVGAGRTYNRRVVSSRRLESITSSAGPVETSIVAGGAGLYRLRAETRDPEGRTASTGFVFAVAGGQAVAWPRFDQERIDIIADKSTYRVGDTANIVVQTPYRNARGLLTVETGGVIERSVFQIRDNTPALAVPIKAGYAPNVFVSVVLVRGREHDMKDASGFETGAPGYKVGYARLAVDPADQRLSVAVTPARDTTAPGQAMNINLEVRAADGRPSEASLAVMVVDEAVLSLTRYRTPDPVALAFSPRTLGVRNASNILDLPHSRRSRLEALFPGGDADDNAAMAERREVLRRLFQSTAYWNPNVRTDSYGRASITVRYPDNLTTFRIMAVAADRSGRMGSGEAKVVVRKPLMIQPVAPRFAYVDDVFTVEARVFNGTPTGGRTSVSASFEGVELLQRPAETADIGANNSVSFAYRVRALPGATRASMRFAAALDNERDTLETSLPLYSPANRNTIVLSRNVRGAADSLTLEVPSRRLPGSLRVEAVASGTPLSELKDSVQYLMRYPNGCIEQTTSMAYPLIVLRDLLPQIGVDVDLGQLKSMAEAGVRRVLSFQTPSGGLSYWPGSQAPHAFGTAFGLTVLLEAKKQGYDIPDAALVRMADYLEQVLSSGTITSEMPHGGMADADTRALFAMTLGRLGRPQQAYIQTLWRMRDKLTPFGLAFLAIAARESRDQSLVEPILSEIRRAAVVSDRDAFFQGQPTGGWSLGSPLRSHGTALTAYAIAAPSTDMSQKLLRGLLDRRVRGLWGNTQENVFGIMGVYELAAGGATLAEARGMDLVVNGRRYPERDLERTSRSVLRLSLAENDLSGSSGRVRCSIEGAGGAMAYLTVRASYEEPIDAEFSSPRREGFLVERTLQTPEGRTINPSDVRLGSIVRVRIGVVADRETHYCAIDDKLPAGLEPLNATLATTASSERGGLSDAATRTLSMISYAEVRDQRVAFFVDEMPPGIYEFSYLARATTPGVFRRPAARAEAMYQPELHGLTASDVVTIR